MLLFFGFSHCPAVSRCARAAAFYKTPGRKPSEYLIEHNSQVFLIDGKGKLRATFFNAPLATMA